VSHRLRPFVLAAAWLAVDQLTKLWASLGLDGSLLVIPNCLRFSLSHNTGALFGMMGDMADPWRTILLVALPLVAVGVIGTLIWRAPKHEVLARTGLGLILGGAIGNLIDRLLYGHVVDFIDVYAGWPSLARPLVSWFGTNRWPTFNVADIGLVCGAALLVLELLVRRSPDPEESRASVSD
jgi:signal peptidase II